MKKSIMLILSLWIIIVRKLVKNTGGIICRISDWLKNWSKFLFRSTLTNFRWSEINTFFKSAGRYKEYIFQISFNSRHRLDCWVFMYRTTMRTDSSWSFIYVQNDLSFKQQPLPLKKSRKPDKRDLKQQYNNCN